MSKEASNLFFCMKNGVTIMINDGYNYDRLEKQLRVRGLRLKIITGHTGWTDGLDFAFAHRDQVCNAWVRQRPHDPQAPYDESDDTEESARSVYLKKQKEVRE